MRPDGLEWLRASYVLISRVTLPPNAKIFFHAGGKKFTHLLFTVRF
jgi:hypothetical protein